jgi:hypothetical protein
MTIEETEKLQSIGLWSKLRSHWMLIFDAQTKSSCSQWGSKEIK